MINLKTENWQINNIETILFDKDGTFIDLHYFWGKMTELRAKEIIQQYRLPQEKFQQLCSYLGYDINQKKMLPDGITALYSRSKILEIFKENLHDEGINISIKELEIIFDVVSEEFYKDIMKYTKPIESAINFIKHLRSKNVKIGIVTSDSVVSTKLTLKQFNWESLFDIVIGRESSTDTKESGIPTKMALTQLDANPKTTVMIGDAPMDYISAKNAGIENTILVATGQITEQELSQTSNFTVLNLAKIEIIQKSEL